MKEHSDNACDTFITNRSTGGKVRSEKYQDKRKSQSEKCEAKL